MKALLLFILISAGIAEAQSYPPPRLKNEGSAAGVYHTLDCVGPAIACTNSSGSASLTVDVEAGDISNLSASDTQVLYRDGTGISGDADLTWNESTNAMALATGGTIQASYLGLAGAAPVDATAINLSGVSSSTLLGPLLSTVTYTGTSAVAAALQSELTHSGSAVSPYVWGVLANAYGTSSNFGINQYWGVAAGSGFLDTSQICDAGEYCVFYGAQFSVLQSGRQGGSHHASSTNIAIGAYIPSFTTPSGGAFVRHGFLLGEPLSLLVGTKIGLDADLFTNADTVIYKDSGSAEVRFEIDGTETLALTATGVGFYGVTPAARPSAYTITNGTSDRSYDANASSTAELADVLYTVISDLQAIGIFQ